MNILNKLFYNISYRFNNENALSDITWIMCQTSSNFKNLFLSFFFQDVKFSDNVIITREKAKDGSRADFVIEDSEKTFVIECKIYDKNHHFEQYVKTYNLKKEELGYIVNYNLKKKGFTVKTWEELFDYIKLNTPEKERELFEGYLEYLKNVCGIIKISKKMNLKGINSLYGLNIIMKSVINRELEDYKLSYYNTDFKESYYGYKFKVESRKPDIWLNMGLWFNFENPVITIGVHKSEGWGKPFCDEIEKGSCRVEKYAKKHYFEDYSYYFEGSDLFYEKFEKGNSIEEQKEVLCEFVDEVINFYVNS